MYNKRTRRFKKGGAIDDKKAMVLSQIKEVHHHADELAKVLANMDTVDAWVVGKMERATTDLSDITHYLDGTTEYAKGGYTDKSAALKGGVKHYSVDIDLENGENVRDLVYKSFDKAKDVFDKYSKTMKYKNQYIDDIQLIKVFNNGDYESYADGGMMAKGGRIGKYILTFYCNASNIDEAEKIVSKYTKEWRRSLDFGKNFFFVPELTWQKAKELENEISPFKLPYPFGVSIFKAYADGGMMAKGGNVSIKEGDRVIYKGEERTVYSLYPKGMASLCYIDKDGYEYEVVEDKKLKVPIKDLTLIPPVKPSKGDIKEGDKVIYKGEERTVYSLYPKGMASLCLIDEDGYEYKDVEEDYQVSIKDLTPVKGFKKKTKGIDLFEDYQDIPPKVQKVLDKYQEDFEDGNYKGLEKALKELEKIGYTFEYGLDGIAYDLRPIGTQGKSEFMEF